ncbi:hypothetical protein [Actinomadura sp. B10D3]|uniref:hypothetical protein n=1 Tax=Actinomadura sp. B10D3 TaxID=3153557 RepID=UPI00325CA543
MIHPHGTVDAAGSVDHYVQSIRDMARKLAGRGLTGRAADLRRTPLAEYWRRPPTRGRHALAGADIKTPAREAGIDRTAFYGNRPYTHLRE